MNISNKGNNYIIRKIKKSDTKNLFNLLNNLDKKTIEFFHPHSFDHDTIKKICESKKDYFFVMLLKDEIIGYSFLRLFEFDIPSFGIIIKKEYIGKGYGKILTKWSIEKAKELGYKKVILKTYKQNIQAKKLYEKIGFKIIGESEDKQQYKMELVL